MLTRVERDYWSEHRVRAMGTRVHLVLGDAPDGVSDWARAELVRLERSWSRFLPDSELSSLHARAGAWTHVSRELLLALTCARELHASTDGYFDPTIRTALEHAGYDRSFELLDIDGPSASRAACAAPGFQHVDIDVDEARVRVPEGVAIDLGGVGKGLAADLIARGAVERGARSALISLGGDLRCCGEPPHGEWRVPVEDPLDEQRVAFEHALAAGALVTSTTRVRSWNRGGRTCHHIIDPRSGTSTETDVVAVVAAADEAWWAEGVAKAIIVAGRTRGEQLARDARVHAWCFGPGGDVTEVGP